MAVADEAGRVARHRKDHHGVFPGGSRHLRGRDGGWEWGRGQNGCLLIGLGLVADQGRERAGHGLCIGPLLPRTGLLCCRVGRGHVLGRNAPDPIAQSDQQDRGQMIEKPSKVGCVVVMMFWSKLELPTAAKACGNSSRG